MAIRAEPRAGADYLFLPVPAEPVAAELLVTRVSRAGSAAGPIRQPKRGVEGPGKRGGGWSEPWWEPCRQLWTGM